MKPTKVQGTNSTPAAANVILIQGAREWAESFTRRSYVQRTITLKLDSFPCEALQCIDLTTLAGDDTPGRVHRLCAKAKRPLRDDIVKALGLAEMPTVLTGGSMITRVENDLDFTVRVKNGKRDEIGQMAQALEVLRENAIKADELAVSEIAVERVNPTAELVRCERGNIDLDEEQYFAIIRGKTAELTACAARLGAVFAGSPEPVIEALTRTAEHLTPAVTA